MKIVATINSLIEFNSYKKSSVDEFLCGMKGFSFSGTLTMDDFKEIDKVTKTIFDWNLLMTEDNLVETIHMFDQIATSIRCVRASDFGVIAYLFKKHSHLKIQVNLETKGRNIRELFVWQEYLGDRLDRLILANEISCDCLALFIEKLNTPIEVLVLGPLRLAYTPRQLFKKVPKSISSEESLHKGYPILQNNYGTQMFHIHDISLLENLDDLRKMNLSYIRIDLLSNTKEVIDYIDGKVEEIKYSHPVTRGFFKSNRSNIIFEKLSNKNIKRQDPCYIGDILEVNKGEYLALMIRSESLVLTLGQRIRLLTPDGKEKYGEVHFLRNSSLEDVSEGRCDQLVLINPIKGVSIRTAVYIDLK